MGLNLVSSSVRQSVIVTILYITTCNTVQWVDYVTTLTHDVITSPDVRRTSIRQQLRAARGVVTRAHAHCVTGTSPNVAPFADDGQWILRKPCGKVDATTDKVKQSRDKPLLTATMWALVAPPGLYWNLTFTYFNLLHTATDFHPERLYIYKSDDVRVEWRGGQLPGSYYNYDHTAILVFERVERYESAFTLMYQVYNTVSGLPAAVSTFEVVVGYNNVEWEKEYVRNILTTGGCVGCQHVVMHVKAIMDVRLQMALLSPLTSCYTVQGFDGPSTLLPQLEHRILPMDDFKAFVFNFSSAFQMTIEIYNYYKLCGNSTDTFRIAVMDTKVQRHQVFTSLEVGQTYLTLPAVNCQTLPHLVFCYYKVVSKMTIRKPYPVHKIRLEHVRFASPHSQDCSYGGLQILPARIDSNNKPVVVCYRLIAVYSKTFELALPFQDYVTESNKADIPAVFLAFYSYTMGGRSGGSDTVTVSITMTQCQVVPIYCEQPPAAEAPPHDLLYNHQYGVDLVEPTLAPKTLCHKKITSNITFIWKKMDIYSHFITCILSAKGGHQMTNIFPLRETECVVVQRLPRYAERGNGVITELGMCGVSMVYDIHHRMYIEESHPMNTSIRLNDCRPPGLTITYDTLFPCGYYTARFVKFHPLHHKYTDVAVTTANIDTVLANEFPHSGSYMLRKTDVTIRTQPEEGNVINGSFYRKISHYDIEFFHLYPGMKFMGK